MAYRTYINEHEWLGNNAMYDEIYEELKRQGCPFDTNHITNDYKANLTDDYKGHLCGISCSHRELDLDKEIEVE